MQTGELEPRKREPEALGDPAFLSELTRWLALAEADPVSRRVLAELRAEYMHMLDRQQRYDSSTLVLLLGIRERLVDLTGIELDPSPWRPPAPADGCSRAHALIDTLRRDLRHLRPAAAADGNAAAFDELTRRVDDLAQTHGRRDRDFIAVLHASASGSLRRLEWLADEIACEPRWEPFAECMADGALDAALRVAMTSVRPLLQAALSDRPDLTPSERRQVGHIVAGARIDALRVHERMLRRAPADASVHHHARAGIGVPVHRARGGCA